MATTMGRPGVTVTEVLAPRDTGYASTLNTRAVLLADLSRGPTAPTTVGSWSEFRQLYGDWADNPPLPGHARNASVDAAFLFFANGPAGGAPLSVLRVVNADALKATGAVTDQANQSILDITALSAGEWGNRLRATFLGRYATAGAFNPADYAPTDFRTPTSSPGSTGELVIELRDPFTGIYSVVERFTSLSADPNSRQFIEMVVNGVSQFITVKVGAGVPAQASGAEALLTGGSNGVTPGNLASTLESLDFYTEALTITYSGHWSPSDLGLVAQYCANRGESFLIIDTEDLGNGVAGVAEWVENLNTKNSFTAVYYPPVIINDPAAGPSNVQRTAPCGGAVLGTFMANDSQFGVWKTPAGTTSSLRGVVRPVYRFTNSQLDELNTFANPINPLRVVTGVGTCIMGGRTLNQTNADRYVGVRRSFSFVKQRIMSLTEFAIFEVNGPDLWEEITIRLNNFLGLYFQQGALRGARETEAFYVRCDTTNNSQASVAAGEVHVEVGIAVEYPAEFVVIKLTHNQTTVRVD